MMPHEPLAARDLSRDAVHQVERPDECGLGQDASQAPVIGHHVLVLRAVQIVRALTISVRGQTQKPSDQSLFDNLDTPAPNGGPAATRCRIAARRRRRRHDRERRPPRSGAVALPQLRAVGHHRARAARRPRRPEAGPAPHPLHDVAAEPDRRRQAPEVREGGRRRHGQLPPARRRRALRNAGAHGAVLFAALSAGGRLRQLRLARRRQRRGHALHRVPPRAHQRRDAHRDRAGHGAVPAELRRHQDRAGRAAGAAAEPAGQRRDRHRRRHGDQHSAAQPRRGLHGARQAARQRGTQQRAAVPLRQRARTSPPAGRSSIRRRS